MYTFYLLNNYNIKITIIVLYNPVQHAERIWVNFLYCLTRKLNTRFLKKKKKI